MVDGETSIHNIMGGMESTGGVRLHNHKRKLKQRFDIIKKLGQGTYGKVQLGINKETGQEVAIKTIKKCKIETEADLIRIRREIQIMSSVQHPNIIHIYEVFENREKMVLVMEYAAGGELYDYLSEHKVLTELEAKRIFRQISTAVFYCHKHKICHRDLKLENILLDQNGNAKIADFGLSNVFDERRLLSTFCGSALYASPEIVNGTPYHGPEVDCWSLGVLLYTLVYGAMPFDGTNFKRLVKHISESDYREPKKPSRASPLIKAMLMVSPSQRADIEKICTHWWVNEGYDQSCLDIAEDLAAQTPVRLDLLLSLVPQSASAEKLVIGSHQLAQPLDITNISSETLVPTRCHSVGSLMELNQNNSNKLIKDMVCKETKDKSKFKVVVSDSKRKLETTPSTEETTTVGVKRKERVRRKNITDDRDLKMYGSTHKHHSVPTSNSVLEEAMEVDPTMVISIPTSKTVDLKKTNDSISCLEVKEDKRKEETRDKECSKTFIVADEIQKSIKGTIENHSGINSSTCFRKSNEKEKAQQELTSRSSKKTVKQPHTEEKEILKTDLSKEKFLVKVSEAINNKDFIKKNSEKISEDSQQQSKETKKLRNKSLSLDCDVISYESLPKATTERRRSKIFETAEKFNHLTSSVEPEKSKKIFIPGVNVGGAKLVFEKKASLSLAMIPQAIKTPVSKIIIDVPTFDKQLDNKSSDIDSKEKNKKRDEEKKRAVDIITGALGKPPMLRKANGSPPISPQSNETKKLGLKIPLGPNDVRNATITVTTPIETKFPFESKPELHAKAVLVKQNTSNYEISKSTTDEPKKCSKMEITLKSATLPRPHKTSKAEIMLSGARFINKDFRSEVEAKIDTFQPQKLRTQRSEVAFPVTTIIPQTYRSLSVEPTTQAGNRSECVIPIQMEPIPQQATVHSTTPPPKPPFPQRILYQRSNLLSRQSTADSDTDSILGSTLGPEPIRKSPREYIIPIAVEGGGYVTPRSGSLEPEGKNGTPSSNPSRSRFGRPRRMGSLLSDASEDESPFSLHRDNEDFLQRHMHRLRSSRPPRQIPDHADSLSSGEDDDDDGFELLTAENLFSTLLSRVRSLTQRLNVDDNKTSSFPSRRILGRFGSNSPQGFWGIHEPHSRRISDSQFQRSMSRDNNERFNCKESSEPNSPSSQQISPGACTPTHNSHFDMRSNTVPRVKIQQFSIKPCVSLEHKLELNFTPCLARRLSRHFIERTRQSLPRDDTYCSPLPSTLYGPDHLHSCSKERVCVGLRRTNSLLEPILNRHERRSPRRSISLFDDEDRYLPPIPLCRKYKDSSKLSTTPIAVEKIQEEQSEEPLPSNTKNENDGISFFECAFISMSNCPETTASSRSTLSRDTSPIESTSNIFDYSPSNRNNGRVSDSLSKKELHSRLHVTENLINESKIKNLDLLKCNPNLSSNYKDLDKCDKETLGAMSETASAAIAKRRSCIPSLRLKSGSLSTENSLNRDISKALDNSQDAVDDHANILERSLLSKLFRSNIEETKVKSEVQQKPKPRQRRISRFLRPDFFDTPREESQYVKEKEAQKAAENERRKSRFIKRKSEGRSQEDDRLGKNEKNEANVLMKNSDDEMRPLNIKNSFLQTLERKLEKFRSVDDGMKRGIKNEDESSALTNLTIGMDDLSTSSSNASTELPLKNKVNSVLGLFKNSESKTEQNSLSLSYTHSQKILSRLRRSPHKGSKSDSFLTTDISVSKIPTKYSENKTKSNKKAMDTNQTLEKITSDFKRFPSQGKEKEKEIFLAKKIISETTKPALERFSKSLKKSPEKLFKGKTEKNEKSLEEKKDSSLYKIMEKKKSSRVTISKKNSLSDNILLKSNSPIKILDNKQIDDLTSEFKGKSMPKLKKKNLSSTDTFEHSLTGQSDKIENLNIKKVVKSKELIYKNKDENESTKKKRIVRVVRKVVKKSSDNTENKEDKNIKPKSVSNFQKKSPENQISAQNIQISELRVKAIVDINCFDKNTKIISLEKNDSNNIKLPVSKIVNDSIQSETIKIKPNREKFKLDFSKIPQHCFRNITPPKRESPKYENPKNEIAEISNFIQRSQSDDVSDKLTENLWKIAHQPSITGNKIVIDRLLRAKDNKDLEIKSQVNAVSIAKKENYVEEPKSHANEILIENRIQSINNSRKLEKSNNDEIKQIKISSYLPKDRSSTDDLMSPTEDTESFDSWSICSADINHTQENLHLPTSQTSPIYSMYMYGDNPNTESVIDRIRRKSFYSRFNDKKRKVSLNAPLPGINVSSSMTLPRKFSFHNSRDINKGQKNKTNNYTMPDRKKLEKSYSMYSDDSTLFRKFPMEQDRYSDGGSSSIHSNDLRSPSELYGHVSSSYDPLKKYLSPTFNTNITRRKYHSFEFRTDNDLSSYINSSNTNSILESSSNINTSMVPKRYGDNVSGFELKNIAYCEDLLAPNNTDYIQNKRISPPPYENYNKFENGYHNGSIELPQINSKTWKSHSNKTSRMDLIEGIQAEDCARKLFQYVHKPDDLSSNFLDQQATNSTFK